MLDCRLISLKRTVVYKDVRSIILPAFSGQIEILPGHVESFLLLKEGDIVIKKSNEKIDRVSISDGECYVNNDFVDIVL